MTTNSKNLCMRDASEAALVGALAGEGDFGYDEFGSEFGDDFGADDPTLPNPKNAAEAKQYMARAKSAVQQARAQANGMNAKTQARLNLLNPNEGSEVMIERYPMTLTPSSIPVFGTISTVQCSDTPKVQIRPSEIVTNAICPGLFYLTDIQVANVSITVGNGACDAWTFNANAVRSETDLPNITPSQKITANIAWTALTPPGYSVGASFPVSVTLIGPAKMAGR